MRAGWILGLGSWTAWTALSGGCVTDKIPFEPKPREAPAILDSPTSTIEIGDLFWVDRSNARGMWPMQVVVREANVNREIVAHVRVVDPQVDLSNPENRQPQFETFDVPKSGTALRDFPFTVQTSALAPASCHRLELVVSGSFKKSQQSGFFDYLDPEDAEDIARAKWWVWEGNPDSAMGMEANIVRTCNARSDLLDETTPTTTPMAGSGALP